MTVIAGLLRPGNPPPAILRQAAQDLIAGCAGRGDGETGLWCPPGGGVALAHRGASVLDLTPDGAQPALSTDRRFAAVIDGYVANGAALRRDLEDAGMTLRGHGDAELVAQAAAHWGINRLLQKMAGSFALALWDAGAGALHLVRDRLGQRPLFVAMTPDGPQFASTPLAWPALRQPEPRGVACWLALGHAMPPLSLFAGVHALPPGHRMMLRADDSALPEAEAYWSPATALEESALRAEPVPVRRARLERLRFQTVEEALRLDAPFAVLEEASATALRSALDRVCDKPYRTATPVSPDGIALQTAFDALARAPEPVSDPAAPSLWLTFSMLRETAPVVLVATDPGQVNDDAPASGLDAHLRRLPAFLRAGLARAWPARFSAMGGDAWARWQDTAFHWPDPRKLCGLGWETGMAEPRMNMTDAMRMAYFDFCCAFMNGRLCAIERTAAMAGMDARTPLADARMLDSAWPVSLSPSPEPLAQWLRGPLRARMQDLLRSGAPARWGIDPAAVQPAWDTFLKGDDSHARRLWTLAVLLAWNP